MKRFVLAITVTSACLIVGGGAALVQACALDNVPSMSMNGKLASHNKKMPHNLRLYAPFYFKVKPEAMARDRFSENKKEVAKSLTAAAMKRAPQWYFGDGSKAAYGWSVRHVYKRKGRYKLTVRAYYARDHQWFAFDESDVTIRAKPAAHELLAFRNQRLRRGAAHHGIRG